MASGGFSPVCSQTPSQEVKQQGSCKRRGYDTPQIGHRAYLTLLSGPASGDPEATPCLSSQSWGKGLEHPDLCGLHI